MLCNACYFSHRQGATGDEIVDALIRLFDIAGNLIPNIGDIYQDKMEFNSLREDHKPENRLKEGKQAPIIAAQHDSR